MAAFPSHPTLHSPFLWLEHPRFSAVHGKCFLQVFLTVSGGSIFFFQLDYKLSENMKQVLSLIWIPHGAKGAKHAWVFNSYLKENTGLNELHSEAFTDTEDILVVVSAFPAKAEVMVKSIPVDILDRIIKMTLMAISRMCALCFLTPATPSGLWPVINHSPLTQTFKQQSFSLQTRELLKVRSRVSLVNLVRFWAPSRYLINAC